MVIYSIINLPPYSTDGIGRNHFLGRRHYYVICFMEFNII